MQHREVRRTFLTVRICSSPLGEDMKPYERSELGGVGEGVCAIGRAKPLTQLRLRSKLPSLRNPLPLEREKLNKAAYAAPSG
jgi:hypothetical protein